jgi:flagellar hook-associated protein 1 FlgK
MTSLWTAVSGLTVSQNALNTTAHNLANVDTKGSVRQQVLITDFRYNNVGQSKYNTMQIGLGAATQVVRQIRDVFYDREYRTENGRLGFYEAQKKTVLEVEDLMGELEGSAFQQCTNDLWTSIQELVKQPENKDVRTTMAKNAESFIQRAETISQQLKEYQKNLNTEIEDKVNRVNELGGYISSLNQDIRKYESNGVERANDLRDKRNLYLDELSSLIDITYQEQTDGTVNVLAENIQFISSETFNKMGTAKISADSDMIKPIWSTLGIDVINMDNQPSYEMNTNIGSLKGLLWARGDNSANYTNIPPKPNLSDFPSQAAYDAAMVTYQTEVDDYNLRVDSSVIRTVQAQFDTFIHGIVKAINDVFCPNESITYSDSGTPVTCNVLSKDAPVGMDAGKTKGTELFSRKNMDRYEVLYLKNTGTTASPVYEKCAATDAGAEKFYKYNEEIKTDAYSLYTLGEIEINSKVLADYALLPLSSNTGSGDYSYDKVVEKLSDIWNDDFTTLSPNALKKNTFNEYYVALWGSLGTKGETLNADAESQETMLNNISTARQNVIGISSDEELANLIKYQHAYNASSRYFNVIDQMLEHLITRL